MLHSVATSSPSPPRPWRRLAAARHPPGARMFSPPPRPSSLLGHRHCPTRMKPSPQRATRPAQSTSPRHIGCYQRPSYTRWVAGELLLCEGRNSGRVHCAPRSQWASPLPRFTPTAATLTPAFRRSNCEHAATSQARTVRARRRLLTSCEMAM